MISEDYNHRWEPLAEIHFSFESEITDDNYIYCLCSRVFLRDGVKMYYADNCSESDAEVGEEFRVHFSDTSHKKEDGASCYCSASHPDKASCSCSASHPDRASCSCSASHPDRASCSCSASHPDRASCYCSASHTDNTCSTDEHDPPATNTTLQLSDSGADLTYQECSSESKPPPISTTLAKVTNVNKTSQDNPLVFIENYMSERSWAKFWAVNGERIIWASWIEKYSEYINPGYLDEQNDLSVDRHVIPKELSADEECRPGDTAIKTIKDSHIRERTYSYDSKVNPYKRNNENVRHSNKISLSSDSNKEDPWLPIARRRSCSEHDRMLSPRTLATSDSMTNVTKLTISSYDVTSSHVTSESTPTDDFSASSSASDDHSNDQTRIANIDDNLQNIPIEEMDTETYWQFLWKKHFGEQYALHLANYMECESTELNKETHTREENEIKNKLIEVDCENSEDNSQEIPTVIEVRNEVGKMKLDDNVRQPIMNKKCIDSVGFLLQYLKSKQVDPDYEGQVTDTGDGATNDGQTQTGKDTEDSPQVEVTTYTNCKQNNRVMPFIFSGEGDEPPEEKKINLRRSHENEYDEEEESKDKISNTFGNMGLMLNAHLIPKGEVVYRKRLARLRIPRSKKFVAPRKTYFDESGNPYNAYQEEQDMHTDDDCAEVKLDHEHVSSNILEQRGSRHDIDRVSAAGEDLPESAADLDTSVSTNDARECTDLPHSSDNIPKQNTDGVYGSETTKQKRRKRRRIRIIDKIPMELSDNPRMKKYWKKRHSLFHRFDEGIKLDYESWFSVTPETVARHLAQRCRCDLLVDAFCGAGGNTIQFALVCERVVAIDIDPAKIEIAKHNAAVYGVADRIEFIVGNFFHLAPALKADVVFLSPPWGGPAYIKNEHYDLETMLEPKPCSELMKVAENITSNVALYIPRNSRTEQLVAVAQNSGSVEIEQNFLGRAFVALTAYFGDLVK